MSFVIAYKGLCGKAIGLPVEKRGVRRKISVYH